MLPLQNRLTKKKDYDTIFKKGKADGNRLFNIRFIKNTLQKARIGFIVSNKIAKKATERNTIKRRMRNSIYPMLPIIYQEYDIVLIAKQQTIEKNSFKEINSAIKHLLGKTRLLCDTQED